MARASGKKKKVKKTYRRKKGVLYIAQKLRKYYPKRYSNFTSALNRAREIKDVLDSRSGVKSRNVTVRNIFSVERVPRVKIPNEPKIPSEFLIGNPYWEIEPQDFWERVKDKLSTSLFIESKISKDGLPLLQGGVDNVDILQQQGLELYVDYFQEFVKYGNELKELDPNITSDSPNLLYFCLTPPELINGKWISYLISCDPDGVKCDYGYDPNNPQSPKTLFYCDDDYETLSYNDLRKEAKKRKIKLTNPTTKDLIDALRKDDDLKKPKPSEKAKKTPEKTTGKPTDEKTVALVREERKKIEAENKREELRLKEREQDIELVKLKVMTPKEFNDKWGKK